MSQATANLQFEARLESIDDSVIVRLPDDVSRCLPSRGQVAVQCTIDGRGFGTVLEPDGMKGHWIKLDETVRGTVAVGADDRVGVGIEVVREWPEPVVPADLASALAAAPEDLQQVWNDITPMARWEWVRWVNATANPATRRRRVEVSIDKLGSGKRRPCCFDLSACTDPALARNGRLRPATA